MDKQSILIVEDDTNFGLVLKSYLSVNNYNVQLCADGNAALTELRQHDFDLCIFDVMMPFKDGFSLAESLQSMNKDIPFIFLTARAQKDDKIRGYNLGALDYLVKPFDPEILLLKIKAILKSSRSKNSAEETQHKIGSFDFDFMKRNLTLENKENRLSPKEAELLQLLCLKGGAVLTREEALNKIWSENSYFKTKSMDVYITKLRKFLKNDPKYSIEIKNLHSKGFLLVVNDKKI